MVSITRTEKYIPWILIVMTWASVSNWLNIKFAYSWFIDWVAEVSLIYIFFSTYLHERKYRDYTFPFIHKLFIIVVFISLIYGLLVMGENYHDKVSGLKQWAHWMLCVGVLYFQNPEKITYITSLWTKYALPAVFFLIPFMQGEAIGHYFAPFTFVVCFLPLLTKRQRIKIYIVLALIHIYGAMGARSVVIRFVFSLLIAACIHFQSAIKRKFLIIVSSSFLIAPFVFLYLAIYLDFNIFQVQDYYGLQGIEVSDGFSDNSSKSSALEDTRTLIYTEVLMSAIQNDYVVQGRSLARGNDTYVTMYLDADETNVHDERRYNEARILNIFTYMGIIGVLVMFLFSISATISAFKYGNSIFVQLMGLYVSFRWFFAWIEDFEFFDLNNLYIWIPMALCFSPQFLRMTDSDFREWASKLL